MVCISRLNCKTKMRNTSRKQFGANHTRFKPANGNRKSVIVKQSDKITRMGYTSIWHSRELWNKSFIFPTLTLRGLYYIRDFFASLVYVFVLL